MVTIQIANGQLDVEATQTIELEIEKIRFTEGIRDPYTNDFDLPKTDNNIRLLECYNLLDSPNQLYGTKIMPSVLTVDGYMMNCYIQVVSVNDDTISVCLYENVLPIELRDKRIKDILHDDWHSIWVWSVNTKTAYNDDFRRYDYGSTYNHYYAQYHAIKHLNDIIGRLSSETGLQLPSTDVDLGLLAQNKYVCPESTHQSIMWTVHSEDNNLVLEGGQHVVNDVAGWNGLSKIGESSVTEVSFNRHCTATVNYYITWVKKLTTAHNTFVLNLRKNNAAIYGRQIETELGGYRNGIMTGSFTMDFEDGDVIEITLDSTSINNEQTKFDSLMVNFDIDYSDYDITSEDYGTELVYCGPHPFILGYIAHQNMYDNLPFDGRSVEYKIYRGIDQEPYRYVHIDLPWRGVSYFGYYTNISDITVGELFHSLCWYMGKSIIRTFDGLVFEDCDDAKVIDGYVSEIRPSSDKLGRKNYIIWNGEETANATPLTEIDSIWLEDKHILQESAFAMVQRGFLGRARIPQYDITVTHDDEGNKNVDIQYNEIDGTVLMRYQTAQNTSSHWNLELIPPHSLSTLGFENITSATEVTIETFDDEVSDKDFVYLDGRKYMVISETVDLKTKQTTITALLVPTIDVLNNGNHIIKVKDIQRQ